MIKRSAAPNPVTWLPGYRDRRNIRRRLGALTRAISGRIQQGLMRLKAHFRELSTASKIVEFGLISRESERPNVDVYFDDPCNRVAM